MKEMGGQGLSPVRPEGLPHERRAALRLLLGKGDPLGVEYQDQPIGKGVKSALASAQTDGTVIWNATAYQGIDGESPLHLRVRPGAADDVYENGHNLTADKLNEKLDHWQSDGFIPLKIHAYGTPDGLVPGYRPQKQVEP